MIIPEDSEAEEPPPSRLLGGGGTSKRVSVVRDVYGLPSASVSPLSTRPSSSQRLGLDVDIPSDSLRMRQFLSPTNLLPSWMISPSSSSSDTCSSSRLHWRQLMTLHRETKSALMSSSPGIGHSSPSSVPSIGRVPGLVRGLATLSSGNSLSSLSLDRERFPRGAGLMMHSAPLTLDAALKMPFVNEFDVDMHELFESRVISMHTHRKPLSSSLDSSSSSATHVIETHRLKFTVDDVDDDGDPIKLKLEHRSHSNEELTGRKKAHSLSLTQSSQSDGVIIERERMLPPREILAKTEKLDSTFELASYQPRNDFEDSYLDDESAVLSIDRSIQKERSSTAAISDIDVDGLLSGFSVLSDKLYPDSTEDDESGSSSSSHSSPSAAVTQITADRSAVRGGSSDSQRSKSKVVRLSDHISLTTADEDLITDLTMKDTFSDDTSVSYLSAHQPKPTPMIGRALLMDNTLTTLSESHSNQLHTAPKLYPFDSPPSFDRKTVWSHDSADSSHDVSPGESKTGSSTDCSRGRLDDAVLAAQDDHDVTEEDEKKTTDSSGFDIRGLMRTTTTESIEFPEEDAQLTSALAAKVTHASSSKMVLPTQGPSRDRRFHSADGPDTDSSDTSSEAKKGRLDYPTAAMKQSIEIKRPDSTSFRQTKKEESPIVSALGSSSRFSGMPSGTSTLTSMTSLPSVLNMKCNHCWMVTTEAESSLKFEKLILKRMRQKISAEEVFDSELFDQLKKDPRYSLITLDTIRLCESSVLISEFEAERMESGLCWKLQSSVSGWMFCPSGIRICKQMLQCTMISASEQSASNMAALR